MKIKEVEIDNFLQAYIICALWSSMDDNDNPLDTNFNIHDLTREALQTMKADCEQFQKENEKLLERAYSNEFPHYGIEKAGHDFWLTRNFHGSGFFDSDLGSLGDELTKKTHSYRECWLYVGDNGKIYL